MRADKRTLACLCATAAPPMGSEPEYEEGVTDELRQKSDAHYLRMHAG